MGITAGDVSLRAKAALDGATKIIARTGECESFESLSGYNVETLDGLYLKCRNFDTLNKKLAACVLEAAKLSNVCYCVDGSVSEDESCKIILKRHRECEVLDGVSKAAHAYSAAKLSKDFAAVSAYSVNELKSCRAAVVYDIDCDLIAGEVKQKLSYIFGEETTCAFVCGNGVKNIKIYELDRQKNYGADCAVAVQEGEFLKRERYDFADLEYIIKLLRAPGGCPWDRVQTSKTIKGNLIEEAYELADAIEREDDDDMEEETGDVLLQAAFHSVLEEERGCFNAGDALTRVIKKLIFRHSHIFGGDKAASESEALGVWESNKKVEKGQTTFADSVRAVPKNFPACMRAQKVQKRAAKSGMDFLSAISAAERLTEELAELIEALMAGNESEVFDEAGDVMFSAVNVCRLAGADSEQALSASINKFTERFCKCEELISADGETFENLDPSQRDYYWALSKNELKKH